MDYKSADRLYSLKPKGKYIIVIENSTNKAIGRIFLEGSYLKDLVRKNYSFIGLKNYISSLDRLSSKIPSSNFEMLYGKEFSDSVKVINYIRGILKLPIQDNKNGIDNLLSLINLEVMSINSEPNGLFKVKFCLKYKGKQWTHNILLKDKNITLLSLLKTLFLKACISKEPFDSFIHLNTNISKKESNEIWNKSNLIKTNLIRLFDTDISFIESLLIENKK